MPAYSFFIGLALKSAALLGVVWVAAVWLRRRSAAVRHAIWSAGFAALLTLPLLSIGLPALNIPVSGSWLAPAFVFETNASAFSPGSLKSAEEPSANSSRVKSTFSAADWQIDVLFIWAAGVAVSFAQMFFGWAALARLRRNGKPFSAPELSSLAGLLGIKGEVKLVKGPRGTMPITYGPFRSSILLPAEVAEWSAERRRVVLLHELAHVRRGDGATHLLARAALGLYWWNPLAWIGWREFVKERERAADDLVLSAGASSSEYATHLLEIARSMQSSGAAAWAAVAMARRSQLEGRLLAILDTKRDRKIPRSASPIAASLLAIGIISPVAAMRTQSETAQAQISAQQNLAQPNAGPVFELIAKGDVERERGDFEGAKKLYNEALAGLSSGPEAATALIHRGTVELSIKDAQQAIADFELAARADTHKTAEATMWMAIAQERENNLEAANTLYQSAVAQQEPNSAAAATTIELYAQLLRRQGREDEAAKLENEAAAIREANGAQVSATSEPTGSDVYRIGGNVSAPRPISKKEPEYTQEARIAKYQGTALVSVEIGADGVPRNVKIVRALGFGLDQKAIEAISHWKFEPATEDGQPVAVAAHIEVNFRLL